MDCCSSLRLAGARSSRRGWRGLACSSPGRCEKPEEGDNAGTQWVRQPSIACGVAGRFPKWNAHLAMHALALPVPQSPTTAPLEGHPCVQVHPSCGFPWLTSGHVLSQVVCPTPNRFGDSLSHPRGLQVDKPETLQLQVLWAGGSKHWGMAWHVHSVCTEDGGVPGKQQD